MTAPTEKLPEIALAFCREVLGWEDAEPTIYGTSDCPIPTMYVNGQYWHYTDLNAVMAAVRSFCERLSESKDTWLEARHLSERELAVCCDLFFIGKLSIEELPMSLMRACLAAQRKLKDPA